MAHGLDYFRSCNRFRFRETLQKRAKAEGVIAMSMRQVDRGKVLATSDDPIQQGLRLVDRQKCIDKDSISLTVYERRRVRHPHQRLLARRKIAAEARALTGKNIPFQASVICFE